MISPGSRYVALGSSFAAGPGIQPVVDRPAARSGRNYPHLVAAELGLDLVDVTYSGATTATILRDGQDEAPPQLEAVGPETELVTITAGGNDLEYIGSLTRGSLMNTLALPATVFGRRAANRIRARVSYLKDESAYAAATAGLAEIVERTRERAPHCRVLLVDYLTVIGPATRPRLDVPLNEEQLPSVVMMAEGLAAAFAKAAAQTGAELVTASAISKDHAVGSAEPWTTGFSLRPSFLGGGAPYHPTAAGMAAVAELVVARLRDLP
ncbi:GDSL-like lipase/acylhydrolase family protein [Kribbella amoyensis]|uniref:GDSL-like lipase/acylhydrolase family protein n=1 Tax=Kribbella amoyensis TaxID=996641 RepID=A0A561C0R6_9ACTN|nr:SGNH/GDSL hydrolase family protein [Kribbella amoyensis]TWD84763.1 GDSL-like lipase/acylhydrolase family protein [Kribbella amoyensis]